MEPRRRLCGGVELAGTAQAIPTKLLFWGEKGDVGGVVRSAVGGGNKGWCGVASSGGWICSVRGDERMVCCMLDWEFE